MSADGKAATKPARGGKNEKGGFVLGMIVGLLVGLAIALGVALYITKVPVPFINKVPQRTAEQDAAEAEKNRHWDPNAPLAGKAGARSASGVVHAAPAAASATGGGAAATAVAASGAMPDNRPAGRPEARPAAATAASAATGLPPTADNTVYFVQAGAFNRPEEAEAQKAKLALQGFNAKVMEREQSGRTIYRVRIGPMDTRDEAVGLQSKVEAAGFETNLVRVQR